jgi:hypothetical protein
MKRWNDGFEKIKVAFVNLTQYSMLPKFHHSMGHPI